MEEISSTIHFKKSLEFLRLSNYQSAIESIGAAINNSTDKNFYMFQKIKILFVGQLFSECSDYIELNLIDLYKQSSLYIFSQVLYYYQTTSGCSTSDLEYLLLTNNIPSILANEYQIFINNPTLNLLEKIIFAEEANDYSLCVNYCDLLLKKDPTNITTCLIKAKCHCLLKDYDLGISTYKKAISLEPNVPSIYNELGNVMLGLNYYPEAISCFQDALDLDPSNSYFRTQLAEGFYLWKKYDSALINFKKVLAKKPGCPEVLLRIASTYEEIHKPRKAKRYYKKVINNR